MSSSKRDDLVITAYQPSGGSYTVTEETSKGITYEITIDGITGYATLSPTEYYYGTEIPTLLINMGEYSLYFIPNEATTK